MHTLSVVPVCLMTQQTAWWSKQEREAEPVTLKLFANAKHDDSLCSNH